MFVSQYSVMSSSTSSGDFSGSLLLVGPMREAWMPEHPRREAGRGVRQAVADRLRPGAHHRGVGPVAHLGGRAERVERRAFLVGESRRRGPAGREHRGNLGRYDRRQIDVDAEQALSAPGAPSRWRRVSPSRRPGRRSVCSRGASSAPPRFARCGRAPNRCPSACRRSRSPASTE